MEDLNFQKLDEQISQVRHLFAKIEEKRRGGEDAPEKERGIPEEPGEGAPAGAQDARKDPVLRAVISQFFFFIIQDRFIRPLFAGRVLVSIFQKKSRTSDFDRSLVRVLWILDKKARK